MNLVAAQRPRGWAPWGTRGTGATLPGGREGKVCWCHARLPRRQPSEPLPFRAARWLLRPAGPGLSAHPQRAQRRREQSGAGDGGQRHPRSSRWTVPHTPARAPGYSLVQPCLGGTAGPMRWQSALQPPGSNGEGAERGGQRGPPPDKGLGCLARRCRGCPDAALRPLARWASPSRAGVACSNELRLSANLGSRGHGYAAAAQPPHHAHFPALPVRIPLPGQSTRSLSRPRHCHRQRLGRNLCPGHLKAGGGAGGTAGREDTPKPAGHPGASREASEGMEL